MKKLERDYIENLEKELDNIEDTMLSEISELDSDDCGTEQIKLNASTQVILALQRASERGINKATINELAYRYEW